MLHLGWRRVIPPPLCACTEAVLVFIPFGEVDSFSFALISFFGGGGRGRTTF